MVLMRLSAAMVCWRPIEGPGDRERRKCAVARRSPLKTPEPALRDQGVAVLWLFRSVEQDDVVREEERPS